MPYSGSTRRGQWRARFVETRTRQAEAGARRCARWRREGAERCRRWAREGSRRPGEFAPPSWFWMAMPFGIAWYLVLGWAGEAWYRSAGLVYRAAARAWYGVLTVAAGLGWCIRRIR
ncbi:MULTISPECIES: hypothetical protein [Kitasatospora]|uniref:Uncharacterized protein n=1 Tax=Kitasatospora cystarginea TaxID=58350 RepID=A0ABN3DY08_9ACTN